MTQAPYRIAGNTSGALSILDPDGKSVMQYLNRAEAESYCKALNDAYSKGLQAGCEYCEPQS